MVWFSTGTVIFTFAPTGTIAPFVKRKPLLIVLMVKDPSKTEYALGKVINPSA